MQLGFAAPRYGQRLEGLQHATQLGKRALGALGHDTHATMVAREHVDDQAGFFVGIAVQHEAGLAEYATVTR